jgi:chitodextrinase
VIVGYSVLYGPVTSGVRGTVATSGRAVTVTGLAPYTNYSIEVSAVNSDGAMGPYTSPLFVVTEQSGKCEVDGY